MEENGVRINKFLSEAGYCSRREADRLIEQGRITVDGKVLCVGCKVMPGQRAVSYTHLTLPTKLEV